MVIKLGRMRQASHVYPIREGNKRYIHQHDLPNPSSRTMALGSTQPLTEMSTRDLPRGKGRPTRKADNLTAICEPIV
jgi:hypothetical protein